MFGIPDSPATRVIYAFLKCADTGRDLLTAVTECQVPRMDGDTFKYPEFSILPTVLSGNDAGYKLNQPGVFYCSISARSIHEIDALERIAIGATTRESISPLQLAAYHGLCDCLELLIHHGADINLEAGSVYGSPLIPSICGIIELTNPGFQRREPVFNCFDCLLQKGADPNKAAFGTNIGGILTPLEVALYALSARIDSMKSLGHNVLILEDIPCANLIYVVNTLVNFRAVPNRLALKELRRYRQINAIFKSRINNPPVSSDMKAEKKIGSYDDMVVPQPREQETSRLPKSPGEVPTRWYSMDEATVPWETMAAAETFSEPA